jgi:TolB-like protein/DNA-binding winged helix-turn-helix (wHTH) protein
MKEIRLNDVIIRPELGVIVVCGKEQPLKPKAMGVLELLATSPGELFSKRDLVDTVWGAAVVTDEVLTQAIYEIRQALKGSTAGDMIRTVPRRGYMLEAPSEVEVSTRDKPSRHWGLALVTLVAAIAIVSWINRQQAPNASPQVTETSMEADSTQSPETAIEKLSIAVLPFENRSNLEEDDFFVVGVHDDLLSTIAKIGSIKVISRTSVMEYKGTEKKIPVIAKELGVANILEGSIQRSGNQVRINVQLIDARTDEHLWAEIYDRELTALNLFTIQSEISQNIADALHTVLSAEEKSSINRLPTHNLQAYEAYLRGRQLMATRNTAKLQQAVGEFGKAVEIDPQFALAWVNLADANYLLILYKAMPPEVAIPAMENAITHAMAIDDKLGEAYVSQAHIHSFYQRRDEAEIAYRRAIELSPNYATAYHWYSSFLLSSSMARPTEATGLALKAFELDPRSLIIGANLAAHYRYQGHYLLAERQFLKLIELDPMFSNAYAGLAQMYVQDLGQFDKALEFYRKASQLDPGNPASLMDQIELYQALGDIKTMEAIRTGIAEVTGEDSWLVGYADVGIGLAKNDPANTQKAIDSLLPKIDKYQYFKEIMAPAELLLGHKERARELFLEANPGWLDPEQWQGLIQKNPRYPCILSWILINTGDEAMGIALLRQTTTFLDKTLPMVLEHADRWAPDLCYLTSGDTEKALGTIETQLEHGHLYWRDLFYRLPMYDLIRNEPRFLAVIAERTRRIAAQREAVAQMNAVSVP